MRRRRLRLLALLGVLGLLGAKPVETEVVRRGGSDFQSVLKKLDETLQASSFECICCVFDATSFAPPPGDNEFKADRCYDKDLGGWRQAVQAWATRLGRPLFFASTRSRRLLAASDARCEKKLQDALDADWWTKSHERVKPALQWMTRLLRPLHGKKTLLVLITGDVLPEGDPASLETWDAKEAQWRRKLLPPGKYWDEERIGRTLHRAGVTLALIAPEARFGDFLPVAELPQEPWASRPKFPPYSADDTGTRDDGKSALQKALGALLGAGDDPTTGGRFESATSDFHWIGRNGRHFFNTDCPSGFGHWEFCRAAELTGGAYIFYPFKSVRWLDSCPANPSLMAVLAPEMVARKDLIAARQDDLILDAVCRAGRMAAKVTPWEDGFGENGSGQAPKTWGGYLSTHPLRMEDHYRLRDMPVETSLPFLDMETPWQPGLKAQLSDWADRLDRALPQYDRAIQLLDDTYAKYRNNEIPLSNRRSLADLRVEKFWLEMAAFHLQALAMACRDPGRYWNAAPRQNLDCLSLDYRTAIRLSDCLDGYDKRTVSAKEEWENTVKTDERGVQGNLLSLTTGSKLYRAKRDLKYVLKNLDPKLKPRAMQMIDAAREVMKHEAESPWGWVVYYSEATTFTWDCVPVGKPTGKTERPDTTDDNKKPPPEEPSNPRGGGSTGAGPTSGG